MRWIDPNIGYDKAASILRSGGRLAIFRNFYKYDSKVSSIIINTLKRHAPKLLKECVPLGISDLNLTDSHIKQLESRNDIFSKHKIKIFKHDRTVSIQLWIEELTTHSPIYQLDKTISNKLLSDLAENVKSLIGNNIRIEHGTNCLLAWKR